MSSGAWVNLLRYLPRLGLPLSVLLISFQAVGSPLPDRGFRAAGTPTLRFATNDVVAFVGGGDVAAARNTGHLETLLTIGHRNLRLRFRNFGWEGDTVFAQPREVGFPSLRTNLQKAGITVVFVQFGRAEALDSSMDERRFISAYGKFLGDSLPVNARAVLVAPPPFERAAAPLQDLSRFNRQLGVYVQAIGELGRARNVPVVNLFAALSPQTSHDPMLTDDGLQLTQQGHARIAQAFAQVVGLANLAAAASALTPSGAWQDHDLEAVRQQVIAKNVLWFNYSRPQNWAFLGGDRTTQPSSHDHRDPNVRWFPDEMERYLPLITEAEQRLHDLAGRVQLK